MGSPGAYFMIMTIHEKTRVCNICGIEKDMMLFRSPRTKTGKTRLMCDTCKTAGKNHRRNHNMNAWRTWAGGKCEICGYNKCPRALEFHHRDPTTKSASPTKLIRRVSPFSPKVDKVQLVVAELKGCDLICANCHREIHSTSE